MKHPPDKLNKFEIYFPRYMWVKVIIPSKFISCILFGCRKKFTTSIKSNMRIFSFKLNPLVPGVSYMLHIAFWFHDQDIGIKVKFN